MLVNGRALLSLLSDKSYDHKISGQLDVLQDDHWRSVFAVMKANLLFLLESQEKVDEPLVLLIIEDCVVEIADDNATGKPFSFLLKSKTTKRVFTFAAPDFKSLKRWIHYLTVSSVDYIKASTQSMLSALPQSNTPVEESAPTPAIESTSDTTK